MAYGLPAVYAFFMAVVVGFAKEVYDTFGYGTPDKRDFIVTALGGATVLPLVLLGV